MVLRGVVFKGFLLDLLELDIQLHQLPEDRDDHLFVLADGVLHAPLGLHQDVLQLVQVELVLLVDVDLLELLEVLPFLDGQVGVELPVLLQDFVLVFRKKYLFKD